MKYFDVLLGRYLGGCGNSSGGGGDFSTATVTITQIDSDPAQIVAQIDSGDVAPYEADITGAPSADILLKDGEAFLYGTDSAEVTVEGDAVIIGQYECEDHVWFFRIKVTGDCTIHTTGFPIY